MTDAEMKVTPRAECATCCQEIHDVRNAHAAHEPGCPRRDQPLVDHVCCCDGVWAHPECCVECKRPAVVWREVEM